MKKLWSIGFLFSFAVPLCAPLFGQTHKVEKPQTVVRAVGVYEWTGDMAKPTASRLIPVTLFIDNKLEDAGVYLARPVPFALLSGNLYELDEAGVSKGMLDLVYARHLQAANVAQEYDDGWFGYGSFKPLATPKKQVARKLKPARTVGIETASSSSDPDRPHFSDKSGAPVTPASAGDASTKPDATKPDSTKSSTDSASNANDPDRPTMKRRSDSGASDTSSTTSTTSSGASPADDPDRPTMKRRSGNDTADTSSPQSTGSSPADDPDRPTLKRHSVEDAKKRDREAEAGATGIGSLNDDPDRPNLHRGKPTSALTEADLPKLSGLPVDLRQMVAVSDAANRPVHDFSRPWDDDAERATILSKMQGMAQAQLASYGGTPAPAVPASTPGRPNSKLRRPVTPLKVATPLLEEQLKGYLLSYGDVPTFVYQAHTDGTGVALRYVTIVAQRDAQGELKPVLHAVTDATHLDRTARMRLVDAVDVEASNRASLLFELRGQTSRQFAVYRLLGMQADQIFLTGTTQ